MPYTIHRLAPRPGLAPVWEIRRAAGRLVATVPNRTAALRLIAKLTAPTLRRQTWHVVLSRAGTVWGVFDTYHAATALRAILPPSSRGYTVRTVRTDTKPLKGSTILPEATV